MQTYGQLRNQRVPLPDNEHFFLFDNGKPINRRVMLYALHDICKQLGWQPRGLDRSQIASLTRCDWIKHQLNLCLTYATGTGKTWLACALGNQACRQGHWVRYLRATKLFEMLRIAHGNGSYPRLMNQFVKIDVLILDDWGLQKINAPQRNDLMEIIILSYQSLSYSK